MIERDFYSLVDLAKRWGCSAEDLLHLGSQGRASICVNIYGLASGMKKFRIDTDIPDPTPDNDPMNEDERREAETHDAAFVRWTLHVLQDMPHGIFELLHDDLRHLEMPNAFPYELYEALKFDRFWWECEFDPPVPIELGHLCMLAADVVRADREVFGRSGSPQPDSHGLEGHAPILNQARGAKNRSAETRVQSTLLSIIAALLDQMHIDPSERGAARRIAELTEHLGCRVGEDSVKKYLGMLPEVIERNGKKG